ncbi:MAG: TetR/AcrR family transcriptional regulator [Coriobacteriales bacterium]|jgi:AcrR family transcriptional regulator|nr:TetR/AcrR family transcriptional regulator [Coriobacteriales bacterium]
MYAPPKNKRQLQTKRTLFATLIKLMETKQVSEISASEIADCSGLTPQTFYRYYDNTFHLLHCMQDDLFIGFQQQLRAVPPNIYAVTPTLIRFAEENKTLVRVSYESGKSNFIDRVIDHLYDTYRLDWERDNPHMSKESVSLLFRYIANGLTGVIRYWLMELPHLTSDDIIPYANYFIRLSTPVTPPGFMGEAHDIIQPDDAYIQKKYKEIVVPEPISEFMNADSPWLLP